jgi:hypothetical protein
MKISAEGYNYDMELIIAETIQGLHCPYANNAIGNPCSTACPGIARELLLKSETTLSQKILIVQLSYP